MAAYARELHGKEINVIFIGRLLTYM